MRVSTDITGNKSLLKRMERLVDDYREQYEDNLKVATLALHKQAVKGIRKPSIGKKEERYKSSGRKKTVVVSRPGDPPNTDTGRLLQSVGFNVNLNSLEGVVGSNLEYSKHLEFGTQKMAARPWLTPAVNKIHKVIVQIFRRAPKIKGKGRAG